MRRIAALVCLPLLLTGCAMTPTAAPTTVQGAAIQGVLHGGQQPVYQAHVYLFAANTTGYGGNGIAASTSNASISLLKASSTGLSDSIGAYVLTAADGSFTIQGDYTCTPGQQVYLYGLGGSPTGLGGPINSAAGFLATLGTCPAADVFPSNDYIVVNEVSTVATAYALAGFATDATHISSSGTALAQTGIANAFANVNNLIVPVAGTALATTPAGNGTVPQATINTLADILAACVNASPSATGCTTLFANALNGTTQPTDTATAAINIAHNPGANVAALYGSPTPTSPFMPTLSGPPNDFTLPITFTGSGLTAPAQIAIDASGAIWITNGIGTTGVGKDVANLSSLGVVLSGPSGISLESDDHPLSIAVDQSGDIWVAHYLSTRPNGNWAAVTKTTPSGSVSTTYPSQLYDIGSLSIDGSGDAWIVDWQIPTVEKMSPTFTQLLGPYGVDAGLALPRAIAIDGTGGAWIGEAGTGTVLRYTGTGAVPNDYPKAGAGGIYNSASIAMDSSGAAWVCESQYFTAPPASNSGSVVKVSSTGVPLTGSIGLTAGGINVPMAIALDGAGNAWVANQGNNSITEFANSGTAISGSNGYLTGQLSTPYGIAADGSGDIWVTNSGNATVTELIGAAVPVITPIAAGLPSTPTSDGSSNLGTRP